MGILSIQSRPDLLHNYHTGLAQTLATFLRVHCGAVKPLYYRPRSLPGALLNKCLFYAHGVLIHTWCSLEEVSQCRRQPHGILWPDSIKSNIHTRRPFLPESYCTTVYNSAGFIFMNLELRYVPLNKVVQIFSAKTIKTVPRKAAFLSLSQEKTKKFCICTSDLKEKQLFLLAT